MTDEPAEMSTREVRAKLADAVNRAIAGGKTYITQNGRRVAAIVSLAVAEPGAPELPADLWKRLGEMVGDDNRSLRIRQLVEADVDGEVAAPWPDPDPRLRRPRRIRHPESDSTTDE